MQACIRSSADFIVESGPFDILEIDFVENHEQVYDFFGRLGLLLEWLEFVVWWPLAILSFSSVRPPLP